MFIDECLIKVFAGNGGDGAVDFLKGTNNPSGGNGGNGGSIYLISSKDENTLLNVSIKKDYYSNNGEKGGYQNSTGKNGKDTYIRVPVGTKVFKQGKLIKKIILDQPFLIAKGGRGGKGNKLYCNDRKNKNYKYELGNPGEIWEYKLKLSIIGDIGFVGKPSAGKSTLLSVISKAKPKIASYDFTTLAPQLGLVWVSKNKSFVAIDLPGLTGRLFNSNEIEISTLKTILKCRAISYVIDFGSEEKDPNEDYLQLKEMLKNYSPKLIKLSHVIVANKIDSEIYNTKIAEFRKINPEVKIIKISALMKKNIKELKYNLFDLIQPKK